ncbi:MAG: hypothetical protein ABII26_03255 [Pseudomonadota bacterium]
MKIRFKSNFNLPGIGGDNEISFELPTVKLRDLLEELTLRSSNSIMLINPSSGDADSMLFDIEINGFPIQGSKEDLEMALKEGDTVTVNLVLLGGG